MWMLLLVLMLYIGIVVSRHEDNTGDMISNWLTARGITSITYISKVSPDGKPHGSFHVVLNKKDYFKVIKHKYDYWPVNVTCRRFFPPKEADEEDNAGQSVFGNQNGAADAGRTQTGSADRAVGGNPGDARGVTAGGQQRAGIIQESVNNDISHARDKDASLSEGDTGSGEEIVNA